MKKINSRKFNFDFFLGGRQKVKSLQEGAKLFGGATKFDDGIYSNIENSEYIQIKEKNNEISIFVPSTLSINQKINNEYYNKYAINYLTRYYDISELKYYATKGSWYSEDLQQVVIEDITIITLRKDVLNELDIEIFINLANWIKQEMKQEGVSIAINSALAII